MKYENKDVGSKEKYAELFPQCTLQDALEKALDIRKFEIELYWKRTAYFWAFIAAIFAGYFTMYSSDDGKFSTVYNKQEMLFILSCIGLVFSFGWFLANKGSKYWQENWEKHVDLLEDQLQGPLYKTTLSSCNFKAYTITDPYSFSVTKINQALSAFVIFSWFLIWLKMLFCIFPFIRLFDNIFSCIFTLLTIISLIYLYSSARTSDPSKSKPFKFIKRKIQDD